MADKTIGELPVIPSLNDDSLIPVEQNGAASHMTGLQIRQFAQNVVLDKVAEAKGYAEQAEAAANGIEEVRNQAEKAATSSEEAAQRAEAAAADVEQAVSDAAGAVREQVAEDADRAALAAQEAQEALSELKTRGGLSRAAKTLLLKILRGAAYLTDQTANVDLLEVELDNNTQASGVAQSGSVLTIISGVTATQADDGLVIA